MTPVTSVLPAFAPMTVSPFNVARDMRLSPITSRIEPSTASPSRHSVAAGLKKPSGRHGVRTARLTCRVHVFDAAPVEAIAPAPTPRCLPRQLRSMQDLGLERLAHHPDTLGVSVMRGGVLVGEYSAIDDPARPLWVFSLSRQLVACVAATLLDGDMRLSDQAHQYCPFLRHTAYHDATVRQLLDMRSGVTSTVVGLSAALGYGETAAEAPLGIVEHVRSLVKDVDHGGAFVYRTCDTEVLAMMCEAATGQSMTRLIETRLWQPMGAAHPASVVLDTFGTPMASGGIKMTFGDLQRLAAMLADGSVGGRQVVPSWFIEDTRRGDASAHRAFANASLFGARLGEHAMFRNQTWLLDARRGTTMRYGAYGNIIYNDPSAYLTCVVASAWGKPYEPMAQDWLGAFSDLAVHA